jgi:hypothetical protein
MGFADEKRGADADAVVRFARAGRRSTRPTARDRFSALVRRQRETRSSFCHEYTTGSIAA